MEEDMVIHGDGIMQIRFSKETAAMMDNLYERVANLSSLFKEFIKNTFMREKVSIDLTMTKNPQLAQTLQKHFMSYFDKK